MRNAIITMSLLGLVAVPKLSAQANTNISIVSGDTVVSILRGNVESCTVKIDGRTLGEAESEKVCNAKLRNITFNSRDGEIMSVQLERLRNSMKDRNLFTAESLLKLRGRELELAKELQGRSLMLTERGLNLADRSNNFTDAKELFGQLMLEPGHGRTIIGVTVESQPRETDRHGAYVIGVTPNGPADKAGLKVKDVIVKVDGKPISGRTERAVDDDESPTWIKLTEVVGKLEAGQEVSLEYRRGGRNSVTKVTPAEDSRFYVSTESPSAGQIQRLFLNREGGSGAWVGVAPSGELEPPDAPEPVYEFRGEAFSPMATPEGLAFGRLRTAPNTNTYVYSARSLLAGFELAAISDKLGSYFGTSKGVLIIDAPEDDNLGLESGDVVTAVDGREVSSPSAFMRILRSYESGESVTLRVLRNKQPRSVASTLP